MKKDISKDVDKAFKEIFNKIPSDVNKIEISEVGNKNSSFYNVVIYSEDKENQYRGIRKDYYERVILPFCKKNNIELFQKIKGMGYTEPDKTVLVNLEKNRDKTTMGNSSVGYIKWFYQMIIAMKININPTIIEA